MVQSKSKKTVFFLIACFAIGCMVIVFQCQTSYFNTPFVRSMLMNIQLKQQNETHLITVGTDSDETKVCTFPELDPFDPIIMEYVKKWPQLDCSHGLPSLVYLDELSLKVNKTKLSEKFPNRTFSGCTYKKLKMKPKDDKANPIRSKASKLFNETIKLTSGDDSIFIECFDDNSTLLSKQYMYVFQKDKSVEARIEEIYKRHQNKYKPKETLSVLLMGQDGLSKHAFTRGMPKTRDFILSKMNALELNKYNMVGHKTFENLMPMLTGRHSNEFVGEYYRNEPFDKINYAFIWNDFRFGGYRTAAMIGDSSYVTAWHSGKRGWWLPYVDYNSRPMVVGSDRDKEVRTNGRLCIGELSETEHHFQQWRQFTKMNTDPKKPYFA